jgi:hypothetical protein
MRQEQAEQISFKAFMTKMNYNRPVFKHIDDNRKKQLDIARKPIGNAPVVMSDEMRFGKYKNWKLRDIPTNYLEWLVSVTEDDSIALKYCRELATRSKYK